MQLKKDSDCGSEGYALIDVLMALFLFSLSFPVLFGLSETTIFETQQASNLTQAISIAQKPMERLAVHSWTENIANGECIPGGVVVGREGLFDWAIYAEWDTIPNLLEIKSEVTWVERGKIQSYHLESLYNVD